MKTFEELLKQRRSIRDFDAREVALPLLQEMLRESSLAPSARNGQPWHFIIVTNKSTIRELSNECKRNLLDDIAQNPELPIKDYRPALEDQDFNIFYNAPCLLYIVGPDSVSSLDFDCALAASYLMFAAARRGLGSCWIGLGAHIRSRKMKDAIGLPHNFRIATPLILGYPRAIPEAVPRETPKILKIIS